MSEPGMSEPGRFGLGGSEPGGFEAGGSGPGGFEAGGSGPGGFEAGGSEPGGSEPGWALAGERDPLVAEFVELSASVTVEPPGVAAARAVVARRRRTRVAAVAGLAITAILIGLGWVHFTGGSGLPPGVARAAVSALPSQSPGLFVAPARSPQSPDAPEPVVPDATAPATPSECGGYGTVTASAAAVSLPAATQPAAVTVRAAQPQAGYPLCDGARMRVFWAVYRLDPAGVQHLYRSQVRYLDSAHNPLRLTYPVPACPWSVYVVAGDQPIRGSIPAMPNFSSEAPAAYDADAGTVLYVHQQTCLSTAKPVPSSTPMEHR